MMVPLSYFVAQSLEAITAHTTSVVLNETSGPVKNGKTVSDLNGAFSKCHVSALFRCLIQIRKHSNPLQYIPVPLYDALAVCFMCYPVGGLMSFLTLGTVLCFRIP